MSTAAESIRKLVTAHFKGDESAFRKAAEEYVEEERRKNHHVLANDLERILPNLTAPPSRVPRYSRSWV